MLKAVERYDHEKEIVFCYTTKGVMKARIYKILPSSGLVY